jgi:ABC-type uncharacterized transport system substrate-binding protein
LPNTRERVKGVTDAFKQKGMKIYPFSAATGEGVSTIIKEIARKLQQTRAS